MSWRNGGRPAGKSMKDVHVVPAPGGVITVDRPDLGEVRIVPVKNVGKTAITVHSPMTGNPVEVIPDYLTLIETPPSKL
jgi:hypothetical protein